MATFPKIDRLKAQLQTSGLQEKDQALFQIINIIIDSLRGLMETATEITGSGSGGGGGLQNQSYLTKNNDSAALPNSLQTLAGSGIQFVDTTNQRVIQANLPIIPDNLEESEIPLIPLAPAQIPSSGSTGGFTYTDFVQDVGNARSGNFTLSGLSDLTTGKNVSVIQTAQPISSKGNATDEFEMNAIVLTGVVLSATEILVYWFSANGDVVVGDYAFAYAVSN